MGLLLNLPTFAYYSPMSHKLRMTPATAKVLEAMKSSPKPLWGLQIMKLTELPSGSVYPILARLERLKIVSSDWESEPDRPGPRRRMYSLNFAVLEQDQALKFELETLNTPSHLPIRFNKPGLEG
jgi:PadR family transcriptional regulator PadR